MKTYYSPKDNIYPEWVIKEKMECLAEIFIAINPIADKYPAYIFMDAFVMSLAAVAVNENKGKGNRYSENTYKDSYVTCFKQWMDIFYKEAKK